MERDDGWMDGWIERDDGWIYGWMERQGIQTSLDFVAWIK